MLLADNLWSKCRRSGSERINRREKSLLSESTLKNDSRIEVGKGVRRSGVGQVISRDVNGLDGSNRSLFGGSDSLLKSSHLFGKSRLVTNRRWGPSEKGRNL